MRRLLYLNKTLCMCVERNRVPVLFDSVSHWNQSAGTHCISIIWSQIVLFTVPHCCDLYALQGHIIFALYFLCSRYLCVYTSLLVSIGLCTTQCVCVCQSVCCVHEYLVWLYMFCVCVCIHFHGPGEVCRHVGSCVLSESCHSQSGHREHNHLPPCPHLASDPVCVKETKRKRERKRKGKLQLLWCCANYYLLQWCQQTGVFILQLGYVFQ